MTREPLKVVHMDGKGRDMEWCYGDIIEIAKGKGVRDVAFTANSQITRDGRLVMGAGAARRVRDFAPGIDLKFGRALTEGRSVVGVTEDYHLMVQGEFAEDWPGGRTWVNFLAVQVKRAWTQDGDWDLTVASLRMLAKYAGPDTAVVMNCPLTGCGGWNRREGQRKEVEAMVESVLADVDVIVCRL